MLQGGDIMERRHFLSVAFGVAAGVAVLAASANATPLPPISAEQNLVLPRTAGAEPAVVGQDEVNRLQPEQVRWTPPHPWPLHPRHPPWPHPWPHHWHHHHWHHRR